MPRYLLDHPQSLKRSPKFHTLLHKIHLGSNTFHNVPQAQARGHRCMPRYLLDHPQSLKRPPKFPASTTSDVMIPPLAPTQPRLDTCDAHVDPPCRQRQGICSHNVHSMFTLCSLYVHAMFTLGFAKISTKHVKTHGFCMHMFTLCSRYVHSMFTLCSL
jgi:hypothetical protein